MYVNNLTRIFNQATAAIDAAKLLPGVRAELREAQNRVSALTKQMDRMNKAKTESEETITGLRESIEKMEVQLKELKDAQEAALAEDVEAQLLSFT